jgi:integrase/recombinase XerD
MDESIRTAAISPLRQLLIDDMNMGRFSRETQRNYNSGRGALCDIPGAFTRYSDGG